jgi:uncharacterized membrane protein HdeD (DUF308 family)
LLEIAMRTHLANGMLNALERNWWLFLLRGLFAILFGAVAIAWPAITLVALTLAYGAYALVDGVLAIVAAVKGGSVIPRWWLVLIGIAGLLFGIATLMWPGMTALILLFLIAGWSIVSGVMQIIGAIRLRKEIPNEWLLIAGGLLSVLFGAVLFLFPGAGALGLVFTIGVFAIIYGVLLVSFALRLRKHDRTHGHRHAHA